MTGVRVTLPLVVSVVSACRSYPVERNGFVRP